MSTTQFKENQYSNYQQAYADAERIAKVILERDPKGLDAKQPGAKLDHGKSPVYRGLLDYFPRACLAVAEVSDRGAQKYSWKGWEKVSDGVNRYQDAMVRHIANESIEGRTDSETGLYHKAQIAWNALAALELFLREQEVK